MASPCAGDSSPPGLPPPPAATPGEALGAAAPQEPPFPDIYGGDAQLWEAHFRGIGRAYRALGKEDDFAIRVLTEDFTLPFPFAWPPGPDPAHGPLFYDPHDRTGFDFLLRGPDAPPPALLRPLHNTAQAALRKRRLERLALSYASAGAPGPAWSCWRPAPRAPSPSGPPPAPPGWPSPWPMGPLIKSSSASPARGSVRHTPEQAPGGQALGRVLSLLGAGGQAEPRRTQRFLLCGSRGALAQARASSAWGLDSRCAVNGLVPVGVLVPSLQGTITASLEGKSKVLRQVGGLLSASASQFLNHDYM
ncbi:LOW QUALITY PROTEIN: uncharacterized protein C8orf90 homolog [Loxodonta africana]|uniref:LOW QUALITY PROTEIN: uncharacterized protein C8orf90 homolog n=1 Tax=Loxodonta africana TaxID=9785 RepID=UPI0030CA9CCA